LAVFDVHGVSSGSARGTFGRLGRPGKTARLPARCPASDREREARPDEPRPPARQCRARGQTALMRGA